MSSSMKYMLPLILIPVVIFAATFIWFNVGDQGQSDKSTEELGAGPAGPPLRFTTTSIAYNPASEDLSSRFFPGYFEVSDQVIPVSFWFHNPHNQPVRVKVLGRSCTSCTHARLGTLPDAELKSLLNRAMADGLGAGPFSPPGLMTALSVAALTQSIRWHDFDFDRVEESVGEVPAAAADGTPTWGIFQMGIRVPQGPKVLDATIGAKAGDGPEEKFTFKVTVIGVPPFAVSPQSIALGNLPEGTPPRTTTVYYWSATREGSNLPPPALTYDTGDPFFEVGKPELVPEGEIPAISGILLGDSKGVRILSVYRFPVTVHRRRADADSNPAGPAEPDIGPFIRTIGVSCPGTPHAMSLRVTATVTGLVNLFEGGKIDLGSFDGRFGGEKVVELISEKPGISLTVAEKEHTPSYLVASLSEPRADGTRKRWTLRVGIPGDTILGDLPPESYVVLTARTNAGLQRVKIPVVGRGVRR